MEIHLIITICLLVLIAYLLDITSKKTQIPTVVFLLIMGWGIKQIFSNFNFKLPDLSPLLPVFGTVGLILIVLEGGLELEINKSKLPFIKKTIFSALIPLIILITIIGFIFYYVLGAPLNDCLLNGIPFCIISSAIAIPSATNFIKEKKEFVIYESSMSDIFGVIVFNFILVNEIINVTSFLFFIFQLVVILIISLIGSLILAYFIKKIDHNVKFIPITIMVVLIYAVSKIYHLPALLFILIFGLFLNNLDELKKVSFIKRLEPHKLNTEVHKFYKIVVEITFLIRTIFFLLFGFTIETHQIINLDTLPFAISIVGVIYLVRIIHLKLINEELMPLLFIVPRGLITIMLFIAIPVHRKLDLVNQSLIVQVVLIGSFIMMFGLFFNAKQNIIKG